VVDSYRSVGGTRLLALDGTEYVASQAIPCEHCSTRQRRTGTVTDFHTALTPARVKPKGDKVIPQAPECVRPQDGAEQQDGEINVAPRRLSVYGTELRWLKGTLLGDDLDGHEPFCRAAQSLGRDLIRVCKPDSHHTALEWMDGKYRLLRQKSPSRKRLFNDLRTLTRYLCFASWEALVDFMLASFDSPAPKPKTG